jgi:hypothetical protein
LEQGWAPQEAQVAPPVPHWVARVPAWQTPELSQQPVGQLVASHTHAPPTQRWPSAHTPELPHAHEPVAEQRSAPASQAAQVVPPAPQAVTVSVESGTQVAPEQQPAGQLAAVQVQVPPTQVWPLAQAAPAPQAQTPAVQVLVRPEHGAQRAPAVPQAEAPCDA